MKTLTIKDLARTEQLDRAAMAAVRGGWKMSSPHYSVGDVMIAPTYDSSIHGHQDIKQLTNIVNATGDESAFLEHIHATNNNKVNAHNVIQG